MSEFSIGDKIIYGVHGVCVIDDIKKLDFSKSPELFYVLKPASDQRSSVFVPVGNAELGSKMKKILSSEEISELIGLMPNEDELWIENDVQRKASYAEIIKNNDRRSMIRIIKTLYLRREKLKLEKKKMRSFDEKFLQEAENILYDEFSYVLNIKKDEVVPFICNKIEMSKKIF